MYSLHITHRGKYIKTATLGSRSTTLNQPNLPALALPQKVIHLKESMATVLWLLLLETITQSQIGLFMQL